MDTGFFIDYESPRNILAQSLRSSRRGRRSIGRLQRDAEIVWRKLNRHQCFTSVLALVEYEDVVRENSIRLTRGISFSHNRAKSLAKTACQIVVDDVCRPAGIRILPLTRSLASLAVQDARCRGLEMRDAIHMRSALRYNCEFIVSTDKDLRNLDRTFAIGSQTVRIVDTNVATRRL